MICVLVPTFDAERTLAKALGGLTRAAIDGLVREVAVIDGGSADATLAIADDAGAVIVAAGPDRGARLAAGAAATRSPWILTLRQDAHLLPGWETVAARHIEAAPDKAAWFPLQRGLLDALRGPRDGVALLVPRRLHDQAGGFRPGQAEKALAARIGRRRLQRLSAPVLDPQRG
jgi:glycosyltransferase involved in cell wall biosynthesis